MPQSNLSKKTSKPYFEGYLPVLLFIVLILGIFTLHDYLGRKRGVLPKSKPFLTQQIPTPSVKYADVLFGKNIKVIAEIANRSKTRVLGLSGREVLDNDSGMLFVFDKPEIQFFWMKDMKFPLDIIWILDDKIVDIDKNVPIPDADTPDYKLSKYSPKEAVNYVLEVNAGYVDKNKIKVGDRVDVQL